MPETILLTGATGFIGSHLLRRFHAAGYLMIVTKRTTSSTDRINELVNYCTVYNIDKTPLSDIFDKHNIDIVIHTATSYGRNNESLTDIIRSNLLLPVELLELCLNKNVACFVNTDTFYTTDMELPGGLSEYVLSKKQFVQYAIKISARKPRFSFYNVILQHAYGPADANNKFIPFLISSLSNEAVMPLTEGKQKRDYIYIDDVADAYLCIINSRNQSKETFIQLDLGTGRSFELKELVEFVHRELKSNTELRFGALEYRPNEIMDSVADISVLNNLGWKPCISLQEGLHKTIQSYITLQNNTEGKHE